MATTQIAQAPRHVFYRRLNRLLSEAGFDAFVEELCEPYYASAGRPGIPPGTYIRMLFVGYFEGIDSQRGIVWRCGDSLSLRDFLGIQLTDSVPDHSSLTRIRDRLPVGVVQQVFAFVLKMAAEKKLISGTQVGVDATLLEANAAMKSIVRRDTDEDWKQYVVRLMKEDGVIDDEDEPTDAEARIVAVPNVPTASVCKSNAARKSNGVSLTCARRAVRDAHGCAVWKRLPNGTHSS
ncbi:MAG: transposase [Planctomycetaceae bacterium]